MQNQMGFSNSQSNVSLSLKELYGNSNSSISIEWIDTFQQDRLCFGLVLEFASWNDLRFMKTALAPNEIRYIFERLICNVFAGHIQVDLDEQSMIDYIGENQVNSGNVTNHHSIQSKPSGSLPRIALLMIDPRHDPVPLIVDVQYLDDVSSRSIQKALMRNQVTMERRRLTNILRRKVDQVAGMFHLGVLPVKADNTLRIFIAGDRSSAGKSSVCLGIIGSLVKLGYPPDTLAYIKPATQSESVQLIQRYCEKQGIACIPIGPLVYYRGFTRAFLAGETDTTEQLLEQVGRAVDRLARGKQVILVDGVGFPGVGSICGTDNPSVLKACGYPVLVGDHSDEVIIRRRPMGVVLVGGSGVGAAVDAFNLNATYFAQADVPVMGAIFNKLEHSGFYSLENCRAQVTSYFRQNEMQIRLGRQPFGFLPLFPALSNPMAIDHVDEYFRLFQEHVDVSALIDAARRIKEGTEAEQLVHDVTRVEKRRKVDPLPLTRKGREEIENKAIKEGAAPSA